MLLKRGLADDLIGQIQLGIHWCRIPPGVLADALERERPVGEHDGGLGALDLAGTVEQGVQQLLGTERSGLHRGDVQAGGLGMTLADFVYAADGDRPRRGASGVVKPEPLIRPVPGQVRRIQDNELVGDARFADLLGRHGRNHSRRAGHRRWRHPPVV